MSNKDQNGILASLAMLVGTVCGVLAVSVSCLAAQAALFQEKSDTLIELLFRLAAGLILFVLSIPGMIYMTLKMASSDTVQPTFMVKEDPAVLMAHAMPLWVITFFCILIPFIPRLISGLINLWLILSPTNWFNQWRSKWLKDEAIREKKEAEYEKNVADLERAKAELSSIRKRRKKNPDS